jgi:predicted DNA-binding transcriptional regulator AlpA
MENLAPRFDSNRPVPCFYGRRFLRFRELVEVGLVNNRPHLNNLIRAGLFPRPIYLSPRRPLWDAEELAALLERRKADRDGRQGGASRQIGVAGDREHTTGTS